MQVREGMRIDTYTPGCLGAMFRFNSSQVNSKGLTTHQIQKSAGL